MIRRIILLVLNGVGLGALPGSVGQREETVDSLGHLFASMPDLALPNLDVLGFGYIARHPRLRRMDQPEGCFGRLSRRSPGSDAMSAWWELAGIPLSDAPPSYRSGLPAPMLRLVERVAQRGVLIPKTDALDEVLDSTGPQSLREQKLVVWGDAGGACYVAAHESMIPVKDLFRIAREIRTAAGDATRIWRVGARPFGGSAGAWHWVDGWRDSCVPPPTKSLFDHLLDAEQLVTSFGKCGDFFNGSGFTRSIPVERTATAWSDLLKTLTTTPRGLIVTGLFDDLARVPRKEFVPILAEQLRQFDARLPELQRMLKSEDCVCLIADHARDPQSPQLATREYAPLLVFGPNLARGVNLGDRASLADLGQTIAEAFQAARLSVGESFLAALRPG